jgi:subfamily B ATP-binding cassette protein HlyB/CyaB
MRAVLVQLRLPLFFFNTNGFISQFQLLNFNAVEGNESESDTQLPFIFQIKHKSSSRFIIVKERKRSKFLIFNSSNGSQYWLALQEIKNKTVHNKHDWDLIPTKQQILAVCLEDRSAYKIDFTKAVLENGVAVLFNKLTYFKYLRESFGFKDAIA